MKLDRVFLDYLFTCVFIVLLIGCNRSPDKSEKMPALHTEAKKVFLNTEEGYTINKFTQDSVNFLVDTNGASINTGQELRVQIETIEYDTNLRIIEMKREPQIVQSQTNTFDLGELKRTKIYDDSLEVWNFSNGDQNFVLRNKLGVIIPTGESIPFIGIEHHVTLDHLIEIDEIEPIQVSDFGKTMIVENDYDLGTSNIVEDRQGNLWTGYDNLIRNNGDYIQIYFPDNDEEQRIENLMIDSKDNIWFSNYRKSNGNFLCKFDGQKFTEYTIEQGLFFNQINTLFEDSDSIIWVGMDKGVILKIDGDECTYITPKEGLILEDVNDMIEGTNNEIWLATSAGAVHLKNDQWTKYPLSSGFISININKIHKDFDDNLWFATDHGISILKEDSIFSIDENNGLLGSATYQIASNQFGDVLVGTFYGLSILNLEGNKLSHLRYLVPPKERIYYLIESIMSDREGNFWINNYGFLESISSRINYERNAVLGGSIFIGANGERIVKFLDYRLINDIAIDDPIKPGFAVVDSGIIKYNSLRDISNNEYTYNVIKVENDYWFSSYELDGQDDTDKIFRLRNNEYADFNMLLDYFDNRHVRIIFADSKGVIWFGGDNNLIRYEHNTFKQIRFQEFSDQVSIWSINEDSEGNLWLGTLENGVIKYDHESYTVYSEKEGLSGNKNTGAVEDKNGNIWISTNNGRDKFNDTTFQHYSTPQGLIHSGEMELQSDVNGNVWVLSLDPDREEKKLSLIMIDPNPSEKDLIYSFSSTDLESDYFGLFPESNLDTNNRKIYVGSESEVIVNVENFDSIAAVIPVAHLNNIFINDQFYDFRNTAQTDSLGFTFESAAPFYNYPQDLVLAYDHNHITFNYTATEWNAPNKISYAYKLYGLDNHWNKITKETTIDYRGLLPGKYTFKVCAIGESKVWSDPVEYSFKITPPWWLADWAKGLYVLGGIFLLILFTRWRMSTFRKRQVKLEKEIASATEVIIAQKEEVEKQHDEVLEAYVKLDYQKKIVETKNREITDSITYAKRLQNAILPPQKLVKEWLNDSFIFYQPKDIVAGDFYWMEVTKRDGRNIVFYAAADCTGHGVPGAMVSVVCSTALNRAVNEFKINDPALLLDVVSRLVQESFAQSDEVIRDGMDIAICALDLVARKMWFAGANNPLYRITNEDVKVPAELDVIENNQRKLVEYKPDKQAVGDADYTEPFKTTEIQLVPGDCIYIFSDGFADQFGGKEGKKYKSFNFKKFLLQIESQEMDAQRAILETEIEHWKGELEQVDDICVIGLRINGHMRKIFTKREIEVIQKISAGKPSKVIAVELNITKNTVDTHRKRIMAKTNAHNSTELINFCKEHEII